MAPGTPSPEIRNIGIVAHIDAGKTTVSERFLFTTGIERRMGAVHHGTAVMDWMEEERKRGITIASAVTTLPWRGHQVNLIDTPGHVDFTVEVERCLRVLDGAVLVLAGPAGVQAQSETVWRQMQRHGVPALAFLNQWDRPGCDLAVRLAEVRARLGVLPALVQLPLGAGEEFGGWVDLVELRVWRVVGASAGRLPDVEEAPLDEDLALEAGVLRSELVDALAEEDDELAELVIEGADPTPSVLAGALRRATLARRALPVFVGSALLGVGIEALLDGVVDYLPGPALGAAGLAAVVGADAVGEGEGAVGGAVAGEGAAPGAAAASAAPLVFAYKLQVGHGAPLCYARIYQGEVRPGDGLFNPRAGAEETVARVLRLHADHREPLERAGPGELVALEGLEHTRTGDVLGRAGAVPVVAGLRFPRPVISRVVEPESEADRAALIAALVQLEHEDPSFRCREDPETGQWLISGMGELHLEVVEGRLRGEFGLAVRVGSPRIAYREALGRAARGRGLVDREEDTGGAAAGFAEVELAVEPLGPAAGGAGLEVRWACDVEPELRAALEGALRARARSGVRFGFPLEGLAVVVEAVGLQPGRVHPAVVALAGALALADAARQGAVELNEPVMRFEVVAPEEFAGGVLADLLAHGTRVGEVRSEGAQRVLLGEAPLFAMFGYSTSLRSLSQGRASMSLELGGFRAVPEAELAARGLAWG